MAGREEDDIAPFDVVLLCTFILFFFANINMTNKPKSPCMTVKSSLARRRNSR